MTKRNIFLQLIVLSSLALTGCEEPKTAEEITASTKSNRPAGGALVAPANWLIVPTTDETPLLLSGTSGPQRILKYEQRSGYAVAIVNVDCEKGINIQQIRSAKRDRGRLTVEKTPTTDFKGIFSHLPRLCKNPDYYRKVSGTLSEAIVKMRKEKDDQNEIIRKQNSQ